MRGLLYPLPDGDFGTAATWARMRALARDGSLQPIVRLTAAREVAGIPGNQGTLQAKSLRGWITSRTTYLADPTYAEALHEPAWLVAQILTHGIVQLDCDDVALLTAALGLSIGLRAKFVVVGFASPSAPYRHVWTELADPRRGPWVPVDPTRPLQGLGRFPIARCAEIEV